MAKPALLEVEPGNGNATPTHEEEACKISRRDGTKAIGKDQGKKALYF